MFTHQVDLIVLQLTKYQGLMYFCMDDMRSIRSLIDTLRIPSLEPRVKTHLLCLPQDKYPPQEVILDMFFELLNIKTPAWYKAFISGRRLTGMSHHASVK
jgi:rapamycin-insensitive companion of mTOR